MKNKYKIIALLTAAIVLVTIPIFFALPGQTKMWGEIQNFGHTPLFGIAALLILGIMRILFEKRPGKQMTSYLVAFGLAILLGSLVEIIQIFTAGDPDLYDFIRDILGAGAFLSFYIYYDPAMNQTPEMLAARIKRLSIIIGTTLMIMALTPGILLAGAYLHRDLAFPLICSFDSIWEWKFINVNDAILKSSLPPAHWSKVADYVGELSFLKGAYPGFEITEPYPDWSNYKFLKLDVLSLQPSPVTIALRIDDAHHNGLFNDRFNKSLTIDSGSNEITISLDEIKNAPQLRKMDMKAIALLILFGHQPEYKSILYIDNIRLE